MDKPVRTADPIDASKDSEPAVGAARAPATGFSLKRVAIATALVAPFAFAGMYAYVGLTAVDANEQVRARAPQGSGSRVAARPVSVSFDLSDLTIPLDEVHAGGPPKDGIPALTDPDVISADRVDFLRPVDRVVGFVANGEARAYPVRILDYHEVVNDVVGGAEVAITYCPLCDSAAAFDRRSPSGVREFGVSGLLYNSNVLMYDRTDGVESLWSQLKTQGVSGPGAGERLVTLPVQLTAWAEWRERHPNTTVLSLRTGHTRDYGRSPYSGYLDNPRLMFPARPTSDRLPAKAPVLGVWTDRAARAYPHSAFDAQNTLVEDTIDGRSVVIAYAPEAKSLRVVEADDGVSWAYVLWFAWYAFHPETDVFE